MFRELLAMASRPRQGFPASDFPAVRAPPGTGRKGAVRCVGEPQRTRGMTCLSGAPEKCHSDEENGDTGHRQREDSFRDFFPIVCLHWVLPPRP